MAAGTTFETALFETLAGGGDTDTNACIVGGLLGAANGAASIPLAWRQAVLECDTRRGAHERPAFLHPADLHELVERLLAVAPLALQTTG